MDDKVNTVENISTSETAETVNVSAVKQASSILSNQINVRLSDSDLLILDENIIKMERDNPGLRVSRGEMFRILFLRGASNNG